MPFYDLVFHRIAGFGVDNDSLDATIGAELNSQAVYAGQSARHKGRSNFDGKDKRQQQRQNLAEQTRYMCPNDHLKTFGRVPNLWQAASCRSTAI